MKKSDLKVIVGGADPRDSRAPKKFVSAFVTNSRLMGVIVVYIHWESVVSGNREIGRESFHQFFYIETTEFGLDSYRSICGDDAAAILEVEQAMTGGLGSGKVDITEKEAVMLVQKYAELNESSGEEMPEEIPEFRFILEREIGATGSEWAELFRKTCLIPETMNQLINYFLMRYFAHDAEAVELLAPGVALPETPDGDAAGRKPKAQVNIEYDEWFYDTLCLNKIEERFTETGGLSYICESLVETETDHRIIVSEITAKSGAIASFDIISDFPISNIETAMKLERPEFITVYEILIDHNVVREFLDASMPTAMKRDTDYGRLYLTFNENNNHLKKAVYRLNDDIRGMIYITEEGQLILAAYSLALIHRLERDMQSLPFGRKLLALAKYEFKEDMFYDFVRNETGDFIHYIEEICEFDPEEDR
ncbi:MAG: hypothetical protein LBL36_01435 [Clostridiales Family XIII bacterium]|jgi:hypothetical protein|nr:hypothetical protein [Clostridiales Family XIII bacterium]